MGGHAVVRRPLEHPQVAGLGRGRGDHLDPGRSGADDAYPLSGQLHRLLGPPCRHVPLPFEALEAGEVRFLRRRQVADGEDEVAGVVLDVAVGRDRPAVGIVVVAGCGDGRVEVDVGPKGQAIGHELEVAQDLGLGRIPLRPRPLVEQLLRERELVVDALDVAAGARVAVPVPGPADAAAPLGQPHLEAEPAQPVERVEPAEPGADDQRVEVLPLHRGMSILGRPWTTQRSSRSWSRRPGSARRGGSPTTTSRPRPSREPTSRTTSAASTPASRSSSRPEAADGRRGR